MFAEALIPGAEYTVSILQGRALPSIRIETPRSFYDYEAKYLRNDTRYFCPSGLSAQAEEHLGRLALASYETCGAEGWGRADFMMDRTGRPLLLEINTVPGMTDHSLVPMAARTRRHRLRRARVAGARNQLPAHAALARERCSSANATPAAARRRARHFKLPSFNWRRIGLTLAGVAMTALACGALGWLLDQPIQRVIVSGRLQRVSALDVEQVVKRPSQGRRPRDRESRADRRGSAQRCRGSTAPPCSAAGRAD